MFPLPVVGDLDRPERRKLVDADGLALARFVHVERDGRVVADRFELEVPVERAVPAIVAAAAVGGARSRAAGSRSTPRTASWRRSW